MKSVRSVSFGVVCCCGCCATIFVFGIPTERVTVFVSGFVIFLASATTLLLVPSINSSAAHFVSSSTRSISLLYPFQLQWLHCVCVGFFVRTCFLLATTYETANTHLACRYKLRQILLFRLQQSAVSSVPNLSL